MTTKIKKATTGLERGDFSWVSERGDCVRQDKASKTSETSSHYTHCSARYERFAREGMSQEGTLGRTANEKSRAFGQLTVSSLFFFDTTPRLSMFFAYFSLARRVRREVACKRGGGGWRSETCVRLGASIGKGLENTSKQFIAGQVHTQDQAKIRPK